MVLTNNVCLKAIFFIENKIQKDSDDFDIEIDFESQILALFDI